MSGEPPMKLSAAEALDLLLYEQDAEELDAVTPAELQAEGERHGYDEAALDRSIAQALEAAGFEPIAAATSTAPEAAPGLAARPAPDAGPRAAPSVASLDAARARKRTATRWVPLVAAAAAALVVGGGGAQLVARWTPTPSVTYPTQVPGPSTQELARVVRRQGLRLCAMGQFGECEEKLDLAERYAPAGQDHAVEEARKDIATYKERGGADGSLRVKPPLAPGERPLQRP